LADVSPYAGNGGGGGGGGGGVLSAGRGAAVAAAAAEALAAAALAQKHVARVAAESGGAVAAAASVPSSYPAHVQAFLRSKQDAAGRLKQAARQHEAWAAALAGAWAAPEASMLYAPAALSRRLAELHGAASAVRQRRLERAGEALKGGRAALVLEGIHWVHRPILEAGLESVVEDAMASLAAAGGDAPLLPTYARPLPWPSAASSAVAVAATKAAKKVVTKAVEAPASLGPPRPRTIVA
jgi:hypothetical protein